MASILTTMSSLVTQKKPPILWPLEPIIISLYLVVLTPFTVSGPTRVCVILYAERSSMRALAIDVSMYIFSSGISIHIFFLSWRRIMTVLSPSCTNSRRSLPGA